MSYPRFSFESQEMNKQQASLRQGRRPGAEDGDLHVQSIPDFDPKERQHGRSGSRGRTLRSAATSRAGSEHGGAEEDDSMDVDEDYSRGSKTPRAASPSPQTAAVPMDMSPYVKAFDPTDHLAHAGTAQPLGQQAAGPQPSTRDELRSVELLRGRLLQPWAASRPQPVQQRGGAPPSAAPLGAMPLRPSLQAAHDDLVMMMDRVVSEEGNTASVLLLGERGTGKTLVRACKLRGMERSCSAPIDPLISSTTRCSIHPSHLRTFLPPVHQLIERALQTLAAKHNVAALLPTSNPTLTAAPALAPAADPAPAAPSTAADKVVGVVRLSGLLHLDERAAFQEIARQLCM